MKEISNEIFLNTLQNCWKYYSRTYIPKKHCIIFIKKFHSILAYKYQGIIKTYERFKRHFDFLKAKITIIIVVKDYEVYIKTKTLQYKSNKELQILSIFERIWGSVIIDFIVKLLKFRNSISNISYNNIFIIIERFIKYSKFIFINESYSTKDLMDIVIRKVINNYRLSNEFVIDRGITFISRFFIIFTAKLGVNSKFFITFHL